MMKRERKHCVYLSNLRLKGRIFLLSANFGRNFPSLLTQSYLLIPFPLLFRRLLTLLPAFPSLSFFFFFKSKLGIFKLSRAFPPFFSLQPSIQKRGHTGEEKEFSEDKKSQGSVSRRGFILQPVSASMAKIDTSPGSHLAPVIFCSLEMESMKRSMGRG